MDDHILDDELLNSNGDSKIRMAGFWIRVGAAFVDLVVYLPAMAIYFYNMFYLKSIVIQLIILVLMMAYKPFMEYRYGATFGKMAVNIKVIGTGLNRLSLNQAAVRYIPWLTGSIISIISAFYLFQDQTFLQTSDFIELSAIQSQILPSGLNTINYLSSVFLFVSVIVVGFTKEKQGIHDMMANTYCIYK